MPSWNIHLEAGNRLADKLKLSGKKRKEFLFGCLLPDINNGYINSPKSKYPHHDTHYAFDEKSSLNFYADYSAKIREKDPMFLGYLFHLFMDGFFNYDFYRSAKHSPITEHLNDNERRDLKHHDFWLFDTNFHHPLGLTPEMAEEIATLSNQVKNVNITKEDLLEVDHILKDDHLNDCIRGDSYIFYTEDLLNQLLENSINEFSRQYLEAEVPGLNLKKEENA